MESASDFRGLCASGCTARCAAYGALAWGAYAALECAFTVVIPWLVQPGDLYEPLHPGVTAALFAIYPLIGAVAAILACVVLARITRRSMRLAAVNGDDLIRAAAWFTVFAAFTLNLLVSMAVLRMASALPAAIAGVLICSAMLVFASSSGAERKLPWVANHWTALLLFGWALLPQYAGTGLVAAYTIAVVLVYATVHNLSRRTGSRRRSAPFQAAVLTGVAVVFLAVSFAIDRGAYIRVPTAPASSARPVKGPNVLLIVLDTVRADHTSVYGYRRDTTPNLRKFAEQAIVFDHAAATSDWTLPTHASLFTGLYASEHGAYCSGENVNALPGDKTTLAETLGQAGYITTAIAANITALMREFKLHQGFQYYAVRRPAGPLAARPRFSLRGSMVRIAARFASQEQNPRLYRHAGQINDEAFKVIRDVHGSGKPFFLFLNYMDAHMPYTAPEPYNSKYSSARLMPVDDFYRFADDVLALRRELPPDLRRDLIDHYDAGIFFEDEQIGRLFDFLKQEKLFDDCLIIVTADHGEAFGEHRMVQHGVSVYEDQISVPLLIRLPGSRQGQRSSVLAAGVDIMPTILETAGVGVPRGLSGQNLLKPAAAGRDFIISETHRCADVARLHPRFRRIERAVRSGEWKLIESSSGTRELYDLNTDPAEARDLYAGKQQIAAAMASRMDTYRKRIRSAAAAPAKLDRDALETMKSLGYVQ